ncbi:uncharacterized protein EKO05_0000502 [Ascochyta rabiei]|uniref:Uncharacterized protein n=1 Tax=Didymella rabiei TaxID=5454 RepID=A0A163HR44_DIDRA|nr:uncharacterized protein EKO05_0000502 [Ascochyta rabiei]KZM25422.1 hypothetical protein ST47_g3428 [Ascochyta rabiei]UPX09821.1 hypothetical protein EKO05_0000502 [Ascochyta rabiei]
MASNGTWQWDGRYQKFYLFVGNDANGNPVYEWADTVPQPSNAQLPSGNTTQAQPGYEQSRARSDSVVIDPNMIPGASEHVRTQLYFTGTPERGWYELDSSYRMRTRAEAHRFFQKGRVLAMLYAETQSETSARNYRNGTDNTAITVGRFGQGVFSQIRRFVIVKVKRAEHFFYACAITTYGRRGVTKPGCNAADHSVVYLNGKLPIMYSGEAEQGLVKDPIMIMPTDANEAMDPSSRLRYGKMYPIEWNVKFRDVGMVSPRDRTKLMRYFKESQQAGFDSDTDDDTEDGADEPQPYRQASSQYSYSHGPHSGHGHY